VGSNPRGFIHVAEAAEVLGCSEERVIKLAQHGLMKHMQSGNDHLVDGEDVGAIVRLGIADELPGAELIHELRMLRAKVERLESAINMLFQVNGMAAGRFPNMEADTLAQLYHAIDADLDSEGWPTDRLLSYCEIFIRLTEEDIGTLNQTLGLQHSWGMFYRLLIKISQFTGSHPQLSINLELQHVRELLVLGRSNLRSIALFFTHTSGDHGPSKELLAELASNDIDMFDDLACQLKAVNCQ
jgi:hypothetical protein